MKLKHFQPQRSRIEMMPLIDSFFLILVYFVYAFLSMSVHKGVPLTLPTASTAQSDKSEHHTVSVDEAGKVFLDKQPTLHEHLREKLKELYNQKKDTFSLYVSGDTKAPHGDVVFVLNAARDLGIEKVLVETDVQ